MLLLLSEEEELCSSVSCPIITVDDARITLIIHSFTLVHIVITVITRLPFVQAIADFPGIDIVITVITFIANDPLGLIIKPAVHKTAGRPPVIPANIFHF